MGERAKMSTAATSRANTCMLLSRREPNSTDANMAAFRDTGASILEVQGTAH